MTDTTELPRNRAVRYSELREQIQKADSPESQITILKEMIPLLTSLKDSRDTEFTKGNWTRALEIRQGQLKRAEIALEEKKKREQVFKEAAPVIAEVTAQQKEKEAQENNRAK